MSVRLEAISKAYEHTCIFKDLSLQVNEGEFLCFLGPSGCGKTTLLRIIAGFEGINAGRVIHNDREITTISPGARNFSMVFQGYTLFPHMSVSSNISYGLECRKVAKNKIKSRTEDMLNLVHLSGLGDRYPSQLSGGQQQRVAIARALVVRPDVLLMDEPFSALDAKVRVELRSELRRMQKSLGVTTIMVTHDQEEAMALADRIVVLNNGCIEQISTPAELYFHPANAFVADFVGEMNYLQIKNGAGYQLSLADRHFTVSAEAAKNATTLAIRPEDIEISVACGDAVNIFDVVVLEVAFLGAFTRITARLSDEQTVLLKPSSSQRLAIKVGDRLTIRIPPEFVQVLPLTH